MKLSVSYLKPGMVLESPVYSDRGKLLLNSNRTLTRSYINALKKVGVLAVHIKGIGGLDEAEAEKALSNEVKIDTLTSIQSFVERNMSAKNFQALVLSVQNIIDEILSGKIITGGLAEISAYDSYTYSHSVDVCVLSIAIGHQMGLPRATLVNLGVGGLLHDLGKTRIPLEILNKPGKLTDDEFDEMKRHSAIGYEMACYEFEQKLEDETVNIILNHHERFDGSGYPRALRGDELSPLDMICGAADVYNSMTTDRVYRKAFPCSEAYEMILGSGDNYFSMDVVEAFAKSIMPYPLGTLVEMSDGRRACVVDANPSLPARPVVKILGTEDLIDLSANLSLVIKSQLSAIDVSKLAVIRDI